MPPMKHLASGLLVASLAFGTNVVHATPANRVEVDYRADGSVAIGAEVFPTREAFHDSALFRESGARCGSPDPGPMMQLVAAASDCGMNSTTINVSYNDNRTLVIPVVFHVIKKTDGTTGAITPALIQSQVDILNEDFNAQANTPGAGGTNAKLQFVLAKLDPNGNPTTGIDVVTSNTYFADPGSGRQNAMKRALKWDPTRFFNIYTNDAGGGGTLGYATFPAQEAGGAEDGVVLNWVYVGRNAPGGAPYDLGRTATHEVGHYLGLFHTFQGGCGSANAPYTSGDIIGDTAREAQANFGCTAVASGCGGSSPIENYMDYSQDQCMTKFTVEQVNRIRCSITNYRWINTPPTAGFTYTASGLVATFANTTTDAESTATALKYSWTFGDGGVATEQNPVHTYAAAGTYDVKLDVIDPGSGTSTKTVSTTVTASAAPDAGTGSGNGSGSGSDGPDAGVGAGGVDDPGTQTGGCCQVPGNGLSALLCAVPVGLVLRRRRRARR